MFLGNISSPITFLAQHVHFSIILFEEIIFSSHVHIIGVIHPIFIYCGYDVLGFII